jgi:hypothetical protein
MNIDSIVADLLYINKVVAALYPVITDQVKSVEAAYGSGNGAQKLQVAITAIKAIYEAAHGPVPFGNILNIIVELITASVTYYNAVKAFPKAAQAAAA